MLTMLLPLLVGLVAPSPVPISSAQPSTPLRQIGSVESRSAACSAIVSYANGAIGATLDNDGQMALAINRLRTTDLDNGNVITTRNGMNDLSTLAGRMRLGAAAGSAQIKHLRAIGSQTTDPARKAEIKAFADALDGALTRQRKAGADLDRLMTIIDGRRSTQEIEETMHGQTMNAMISPAETNVRSISTPGPILPGLGPDGRALPANPGLREVADDFQTRVTLIVNDEGTAADHALGTVSGC